MSNVPKLRFKEFSGEWLLTKLDDLLVAFVERVPANTHIPIYSSSRTGLKPQAEYFDNRELANEGEYGVVPRGFFTYRHMSDDLTFKFNINQVHDKIAVSKEYPVFTTKEKLDSIFLLNALNFGNTFKQYAIAQKAGGTRTRLYFKKLCALKLLLPSKQEQEKIASFLTSADSKIELLTKKEELLSSYKKGVMQKIFSGEIRFKADDGSEFCDWEEKKLGDLTKIVVGGTPSTTNDEYWINGTVNWLSSGDINNGIIKKSSKMITELGLLKSSAKLMPKDTVVLAMTGATLGRIGYLDIETSGNQSVAGMIPNSKFEAKFLFYTLQKNTNTILSMAGGAAQAGINKATIESLEFSFPCLVEQTKIANFLSSIDAKIEQVQKQLNSIKEFKKALLQQMFV
jgi:type I restriction enzyme S subunit